MSRAEQIQNRLEEIDAELGADPPHPPFGSGAYILWLLDHYDGSEPLPEDRRAALIDERRRLVREYELLPKHAKEDR